MQTSTTSEPAFPMPRDHPFDPPEKLLEFQASEGPKRVRMWDGSPAWLFTRFDDVRAVLGDNRFTTVPTTPGFPMLSPARDAILNEPPTFVRMDPPEHGRFRRMLTKEFMVKRMDALRPRIEELIGCLLDQLEAKGPPAELVADFALPLTSRVISELLGIPYEDSDFFQEQSRLKVLMDVDPEVPRQASANIIAYLDQLITAKENAPGSGEDLLSRLIIEQVQPGNLGHDDAVRMAELLLMAGHETTANQIVLGTLSFILNPDQKALLLGQPDLLRNAVNEMLRYHSIVHFNGARVALADVTVGGQLIRKGEGVFALVAPANRDPAAFECPHAFDITRKADHHLAFSYGIHQCLGQPLARAELQSVFGTIFHRLPGLKLAVPLDEIRFKQDSFIYGVEQLPLTW